MGLVLGWLAMWVGAVAVADALLGGMLAVELCVFWQCLFLLHFETDNYTYSWSQLQQLTYAMINPIYYSNQDSNVVLKQAFQDF